MISILTGACFCFAIFWLGGVFDFPCVYEIDSGACSYMMICTYEPQEALRVVAFQQAEKVATKQAGRI